MLWQCIRQLTKRLGTLLWDYAQLWLSLRSNVAIKWQLKLPVRSCQFQSCSVPKRWCSTLFSSLFNHRRTTIKYMISKLFLKEKSYSIYPCIPLLGLVWLVNAGGIYWVFLNYFALTLLSMLISIFADKPLMLLYSSSINSIIIAY